MKGIIAFIKKAKKEGAEGITSILRMKKMLCFHEGNRTNDGITFLLNKDYMVEVSENTNSFYPCKYLIMYNGMFDHKGQPAEGCWEYHTHCNTEEDVIKTLQDSDNWD